MSAYPVSQGSENRQPSSTGDADALHRFVLLGASNLTQGFPLILENLSARLEGPLRIHAALGYGRSFGIRSHVLFRGLPGILQSGLWDDFESSAPQAGPLRALITDIGNDLIYGVPVPHIVEWLEVCFQKLEQHGAETIVTLLPLGSVETLSPLRYHVARTILFPGRGCPWPEMRSRIYELNARLQELCTQFGARVFTPPGQWYGFDPIHIRPKFRARAWSEILSLWTDFSPPPVRSAGWKTRWSFWSSRPAEQSFFGWRHTMAQPALQSPRATVSLF